MEGLFNPVSILLHVVNALILFAALYFLLYKPVRKFLNARTQRIQNELENARSLNERANMALNDADQKLIVADKEVASTISMGAQQAQQRAGEIISAANDQAKHIIDNAHKEAEVILNNAREAMADEAATLAIQIASKVLSREVSASENEQLINDFIKKVG